MSGGVYQIRNLINNNIYVGSAVNFKRRWSEHKKILKLNSHHSPYLQNSWNKHGKRSFVFEILEEISQEELLLSREQFFIDNLKPKYNICKIAGNSLGYKFTKEQKLKMRGEKSIHSKLTEKQVLEIRELYKNKIKNQYELAEKYNVTRATIQAVVRGRSWNFLSFENIKRDINENHPRAKLNWEQVKEIRDLYKTGKFNMKELSDKYLVCFGAISDIIRNINWFDPNYEISKRKRIDSRATLNWEQIKKVRDLYRVGNFTQKEIAEKFNISRGYIQRVLENKNKYDKLYIYVKKTNLQNGENNPRAKLTWEQVKEIRNLYKTGNYFRKDLAEKFNVSEGCVQDIVKNRNWFDSNYVYEKRTKKHWRQ
jgi:group I intron endonuclease